MKINPKATVIILVLIILTSFVLFNQAFFSYFFQDDWFTIRISNAASLKDILSFFLPRTDVIYYRPLGMQIPFFIMTKFFGLNPLPFHVFIFLVHMFNILLVFFFIRALTKRIDLSLLVSFFYATSAIHFIPMFWSSTLSFPLGLTFILLTFNAFLKWLDKKNIYWLIIISVWELLALLTIETSLLIPWVILAYSFIYKKIHLKLNIALFILPALYTILRFYYLPRLTDSYNIEIGKKTFYAFASYFLWLFNWPEEIRNQLENIRAGNFSYVYSFPSLAVSLIVVMILICILIVFSMKKLSRDKNNKNNLWFSIALFIISLSLPLFFPNHTYPYYLFLPMIALSLLVSLALSSIITHGKFLFNIIIICVVVTLWLFTTSSSINFSMKNHWAPQRARISELVVTDMLRKNPTISTNQEIYLHNDPNLKIILSNQDAFQVVYNKNITTLYYGKSDPIWKDTADYSPIEQKIRLDWDYVRLKKQ